MAAGQSDWMYLQDILAELKAINKKLKELTEIVDAIERNE